MTLRVGYTWPDTTVLGPGHRYVIWLQGCRRRCFRCTSPDLQPLQEGREMLVEAMVEDICTTPDISGITISGGEPLLQAGALAELLERVGSRRPELTVILFTGYRLEQVEESIRDTLLSKVDLLIDGEYIDERNRSDIGLRGSDNQHFHFLTDRLLPQQEEITKGERRREMHMIGEHELLTIGIAPRRRPQDI